MFIIIASQGCLLEALAEFMTLLFKIYRGTPPPSFKDHRKAKNTYISRYREIWVDKLKSSTSMSKLYCITDLIRFMMNEAEKLMKGYVHKDDFFIVHDDLVLMTAKETIK